MWAARKYRNVPVVVDGLRFDSKAEARRWVVLRLLEKAGEIRDLRRQVTYPLIVNGVKVGSYRSDFDYVWIDGRRVVEDVKSRFTKKLPMYQLKKKLMRACWGVDISEIEQ